MNNFNLTDLDVNEINTIIAGLMELPGKVSLGLYTKIKTQIDAQLAKQNGGATEAPMPWKSE